MADRSVAELLLSIEECAITIGRLRAKRERCDYGPDDARMEHIMQQLLQEHRSSVLRPIDQLACTWTEDANGFWDTSCDNAHTIINGTPADNLMRYCCYCGHLIVQKLSGGDLG